MSERRRAEYPIYTCEWCKEPIYEGDKYMDTPEGRFAKIV